MYRICEDAAMVSDFHLAHSSERCLVYFVCKRGAAVRRRLVRAIYRSSHFIKILPLFIFAVGLAGCGERHSPAPPPPTFSEQEVRVFVTAGRTIAEITNRFGIPGAVMTNDGHIVMWFSNPVALSNKEVHPFGFSASFTNGMVEKWEVLRITFNAIK
jgi:hypothetical protein